MRRRPPRLAGALALVVAWLVAAPVTAQDAAPEGDGAFTDVRVEGDTVVLVLNLEVVYAPSDSYGPPAPDAVDYLNDGFANAQKLWNDAFERLGDCPKLRLDLNVRYTTGEGYEGTGHIVYPYSQWRAGTFPDGRGLPTVEFPGLPPDTPGDADIAAPYDDAAVAYLPDWVFGDPWALAHELGHLFGLGDDYRDGEVLPGREGTLMGGTLGGDYVDRAIVNDITAIAEQAGYDLPDCELWTGTMVLRFDGNIESGAEYPCRGEATFRPVVLTVDAGGAVTGTTEIVGQPYVCESDVGPVPGVDPSGGATISGTKTDAGFDLLMVPTAGTGCCPAWPGDRLGHVVVPLVAPDAAETTFSSTNDIGQTWVGSLSLEVQLECISCPDAAPG